MTDARRKLTGGRRKERKQRDGKVQTEEIVCRAADDIPSIEEGAAGLRGKQYCRVTVRDPSASPGTRGRERLVWAIRSIRSG